MNDKELLAFVEWLPDNSELFANLNRDAIIAQINDLATSEEGKATLVKLTKQYKSNSMELFKKGGKLNYLLCLKKGGNIQDCGCGNKIKKGKDGGDKVVEKRNDGVNGVYSKETLNNGTVIEQLSRRNPDESVTYTERQITPQRDTLYYMYNNTTPPMDRYVVGNKFVTPTAYENMGWLGKHFISGVRPAHWDEKFDSYQEGGIVKAQNGTSKVAKSVMYDSAFELAPEVFESKKDVRNAYKVAKGWGREQGLSGRDLRNWSRNQVIDKVNAYAGDEPLPNVPLPPDGKVARSTMFETSQEFTPQLTRKDVRRAYNIAKNWGREDGLKGNDLRQYARNTVIDKMYDYADGPDTTLVNGSPSVNNGTSVESAASPRTTNIKRNVFDFVQNNGLSRAQTRLAYQNQKNALREQGLRGSELRQTALNNMTNSFLPKINNDIEFDDNDIVIDDTFTPLANTPMVQKMDRFGGSFNSAFTSARNSGLNEFTWNGNRYNTDLAINSAQSKFIDAVNTGMDQNHYVTSGPDGQQFVQKRR